MTRNERKRDNRYRLMLIVSVIVCAIFCILVLQNAKSWDDGYKPARTSVSQTYADDSWHVEEDENVKIEAALLSQAHEIQNCTVTHYAVCVECCGNDRGITASGRKATPYVSVAVDPCVIPLGSDVLVDYGDGEINYYRADDTGSGVTGDHIDLCVGSYDEAKQAGVKTATAYYIPAEEADTN